MINLGYKKTTGVAVQPITQRKWYPAWRVQFALCHRGLSNPAFIIS